FSKHVLTQETRASLASAYASSLPYLHGVLEKLFDDSLLRKVREEITSALHFSVKETDIYKILQTGDLANLDGLPASEAAQLASLRKLRDALYSETFRSFLSDVTGCGPLSGSKTDMSTASYTNGCHLLNHDDVIGTRRVSYILYLVDPDEPWEASNGGALELYPVLETGTPDVKPSTIIPPKWNNMVFFTVQPGHSFHSVEEVVVPKNRLSISGWFHAPQEGEEGYTKEEPEEVQGDAPSSLAQLQAAEEEPFEPYEEPLDVDALDVLDEKDLAELSQWLNPHYLDTKTLARVSERFLDESSIQLVDFLKKEVIQELAVATRAADTEDGLLAHRMAPHGTGERGLWRTEGPPHKHRFMTLSTPSPSAPPPESPSPDPTTTIFTSLHAKLFPSPAFRRWLAVVTRLCPLSRTGVVRRFRPGLDYTLATSSRSRAVLDATLCAATRVSARDAELWASDEVGGYECYMAPHDGEEDPAVYRQMDDDGALLTVSAGWNVLTLVLRDPGLLKFVKYVSAAAPGSRWDVAFEYDLPPDEEED
ncbi:Oxoglutarate and iron-dependent oxygenase degradation C-term-domain-containing protein, partial [Blyttiomyces helicus]